ncbi:MAG: FkbM family methyltransferase [Bacteroidetes bacterium]|nr:FkbM family methyltransferase [Bacteroidota bacterium]
MVKRIIRNFLTTLSIDLTKNLKYDRLTIQILEKVVSESSNCIDVGCHKGEMLDLILKYAPLGIHYAFEPIPVMFTALQAKYPQTSIHLFNSALSDRKGTTSFNYVKNAPAYSGIMKRKYDVKTPDIEEINVKLELLDHLIPVEQSIQFIKIDVEGAEYGVLKGAKLLLMKYKPFVVFEFGLGASDYYFTTPEMMFELLVDECGLHISNLSDWLKNKPPLNLTEFKASYENSKDYYFLAHP